MIPIKDKSFNLVFRIFTQWQNFDQISFQKYKTQLGKKSNWLVDLFLKCVLTVNFQFEEKYWKKIINCINYFESSNYITSHPSF